MPSSPRHGLPPSEELLARAERLAGDSVAALTPVGMGGNNRLFHLRTQRGESYALKLYPPRIAGERNRMAAETAALGFMKSRGIEAVPHLYGVSEEHGMALLEWIEGRHARRPGEMGIEAVVRLASQLKELAHDVAAAELPLASDPCFSAQAVVDQLERRRHRFLEACWQEAELALFLRGAFQDALERLSRRAERLFRMFDTPFDRELPHRFRTLSPSDFGFQNAIQRPDGRLIFLDFEYFGWDDPVKMASDFMLHPGNDLSRSLQDIFARRVVQVFGDDPTFIYRLHALFPLFGLVWCLILLNEHLPEKWSRRLFAGGHGDWAVAKARQMDKAKRLMERVPRLADELPVSL